MSRAKRNRALRKWRTRLKLDNLSPKIASGITEGASAEEALSEHPDQPGSAEAVDLSTVTRINRVPVFRAVLKDSLDSVWLDEPTGRLQRDAVVMVNPEVREALLSGWMCLRCYEPQDEAFPAPGDANHLPGCTYPISERQAIDVRVEMRGNEHLGPNAGISVYLEEQEERHLRALQKARLK